MSTVKEVQISGTANSVTTLEITLERTVAKVAMRVTVDEEFAKRHNGAGIKITHVSVLKTQRTTNVFNNVPIIEQMNMTISQAPNAVGKTYISLFNLFENCSLSAEILLPARLMDRSMWTLILQLLLTSHK